MGYFRPWHNTSVENNEYDTSEYGNEGSYRRSANRILVQNGDRSMERNRIPVYHGLSASGKYRNLIPLLAVGTLAEGLVLLVHGLVLSVPLFPFVGDVAFCLAIGLGLLI